MNLGLVIQVLGRLCLFLSALLLVPAFVALGHGGAGREVSGFLVAAAVAGLLGISSLKLRGRGGRFGAPEGFACVTLGWTLAGLVGAIPYWWSGSCGFTDAFFEAVSGFTTTGASIMRDVEGLPRGILFWRSFTQWLGGMGIVALFVAILPALGAGGNFLFQAEVPGPTTDRLRPRISQTAKLLWTFYLGLTVILVGLLWGFGMTPFESVCHSFTTCSTGGFSTSNQSLGGFSPTLQWIVTLFMFLSGINFTMHFLLLQGDWRKVVTNPEVKLYAALTCAGVALVVASLYLLAPARPALPGEGAAAAVPLGFGERLRHGAFQLVSMMTTTGFGTHDFDRWPHLGRTVLVLFMFCGGCAGSTAGGMKVARVLLLSRYARREIVRFLHPSAILPIKVSGRTVPETAVTATAAFFILFAALYAAGVLFMLALGEDTTTSLTSVVACISNIGPGLGDVGPTRHYADIPAIGKWFLSGYMLLGRLELYSVVLLFAPSLWRK